MPTYPLYTYTSKTQQQIRDDYLRTIKNGLIALGNPAPNVGPGSDYYLKGTALGNEIAVVQANDVLLADQHMPDTAGGVFLDRWLAQLGLQRNPAIGSTGVATFTASVSSVLITAGTQAIDSAGLRYQVAVTSTYTSGGQIPFLAIDTGKATNHANGDTLQWVSPPPFCAPTLTVGTPGGSNGFSNGADSEVGLDEPPRQRLLGRMANPPAGGNWADVVRWALASAPGIVQGAWSYPAALGAGTTFYAVTEAPQFAAPLTSTSKDRDIASAIMTGQVLPYVLGSYPEHALVVGTSVANQPADIAIQLSLPAAPTASPPGPGGGWLDGSPWPSSIGGAAPVTVTATSSSTQFTVNATTPPIAGVSSIAWLNPSNWQLYTAHVVSFTGTSGAYIITIDTPMPGIAIGHCIFPQSANQAAYVAAAFTAFSTMGPGEWLPSTSPYFGRAFRHQVPSLAWPYSLGAVFLRQIINVGPEVLDANWIYRSTTTPTVPGIPTVNAAGVLTSAPPNVLTPRNIGFYAA